MAWKGVVSGQLFRLYFELRISALKKWESNALRLKRAGNVFGCVLSPSSGRWGVAGRLLTLLCLPRTTSPRSTVTDTDILRPQCPFPGTLKILRTRLGPWHFYRKGKKKKNRWEERWERGSPTRFRGVLRPPAPLLLKIFSVKVSR